MHFSPQKAIDVGVRLVFGLPRVINAPVSIEFGLRIAAHLPLQVFMQVVAETPSGHTFGTTTGTVLGTVRSVTRGMSS